jgi:hypothetical protein
VAALHAGRARRRSGSARSVPGSVQQGRRGSRSRGAAFKGAGGRLAVARTPRQGLAAAQACPPWTPWSWRPWPGTPGPDGPHAGLGRAGCGRREDGSGLRARPIRIGFAFLFFRIYFQCETISEKQSRNCLKHEKYSENHKNSRKIPRDRLGHEQSKQSIWCS